MGRHATCRIDQASIEPSTALPCPLMADKLIFKDCEVARPRGVEPLSPA
jgi:hypothetical protein